MRLHRLEVISKSMFEEVILVQCSYSNCKESSLAQHMRVCLSVSWARARSERRLFIVREVLDQSQACRCVQSKILSEGSR